MHAFVNNVVRSVGTELYGRHTYETMVYRETGGDQGWRDFDAAAISG